MFSARFSQLLLSIASSVVYKKSYSDDSNIGASYCPSFELKKCKIVYFLQWYNGFPKVIKMAFFKLTMPDTPFSNCNFFYRLHGILFLKHIPRSAICLLQQHDIQNTNREETNYSDPKGHDGPRTKGFFFTHSQIFGHQPKAAIIYM